MSRFESVEVEAVNRGAKDGGSYTVGCNIEPQHEKKPNRHLDCWIRCA